MNMKGVIPQPTQGILTKTIDQKGFLLEKITPKIHQKEIKYIKVMGEVHIYIC